MIENITIPFRSAEKEKTETPQEEEILKILEEINKEENDQESLKILEEIKNNLENLEKISVPIKNFFNIVLNNTQKKIKIEEPEINSQEATAILKPLENAIPQAIKYILLKIASSTLDNSINKENIEKAKEDVLILIETFKKLVAKELVISNNPPEINPDQYKFYFLEKNTENNSSQKINQNEPIILIVQPYESSDPYHPSQAKINCKVSLEKDISLRLDRNEQGFYVDISSKNIDQITQQVDKKIKEEIGGETGKILQILSEKSPKTHHVQIEKIPSESYQKSQKIFALLSINFLKLLNDKYNFQTKFPKQNFKKYQQEKLNEIYK